MRTLLPSNTHHNDNYGFFCLFIEWFSRVAANVQFLIHWQPGFYLFIHFLLSGWNQQAICCLRVVILFGIFSWVGVIFELCERLKLLYFMLCLRVRGTLASFMIRTRRKKLSVKRTFFLLTPLLLYNFSAIFIKIQ